VIDKNLTLEEVMQRIQAIHGDLYVACDQTEYTNSNTKMALFCTYCEDIFEQYPKHLTDEINLIACQTCSSGGPSKMEVIIAEKLTTKEATDG